MTRPGSRHSVRVGAGAVLFVAALFALGGLRQRVDAQAAGGALETRTLRVGLVVPAASFLPIYLLAERAPEDEALTVEVVNLRGAATLSQALASGAVDVGVAGLGRSSP